MSKNEKHEVGEIFNSIVEQKRQKEDEWIKTCVTANSALLGILIAFDDNSNSDVVADVLFSSVLGSMGLLILSGLFLLYKNVHLLRVAGNEYFRLTNELNNHITSTRIVYPEKKFKLIEKVFFISLIICIILLIIYGSYSRFL